MEDGGHPWWECATSLVLLFWSQEVVPLLGILEEEVGVQGEDQLGVAPVLLCQPGVGEAHSGLEDPCTAGWLSCGSVPSLDA